MLALEAIQVGALLEGLVPQQTVRVVAVQMLGQSCNCTYRLPDHSLREQLLFRADEARLSLAEAGSQWGFQGDGAAFKLAAEAYRIQLAHLFDPYMAVHTANVEPLPHQITAVYEAMLPRMPLRFVLADDPGAGKTVMAGLLIQELLLRSDAKRILIVAPGSLVEQWRVELRDKFGLNFTLYHASMDGSSPTGNAFEQQHQCIARLDQLARNEDARSRAEAVAWDLIIFDEAHKLSASWSAGEVKRTQRHELALALGARTRHLLLMTATPHNGKEEDFQLFLSLLDSDRFYGQFRDGVHKVDTSDLMRRMVKEDLLRFDGTPLFPERRAYTAKYQLSAPELELYLAVTEYVREGMNRLDKLKDGKKRGSVGFALTQLQRRLASSPRAISTSLQRRLAKLKKLGDEESLRLHLNEEAKRLLLHSLPEVDEDWEDELTAEELEDQSEALVSGATVAESLEELNKEIANLEHLVLLATRLAESGEDKKWDELSKLLQDSPEMRLASGDRRKLIIFTEHRDTLLYLKDKVGNLLGLPDAVVCIDGSTVRERRLEIQAAFRQDPGVLVLIATDAAGEGVNLQNANLMINYDLPWNPNRLEQRFGRIHRIGQTEVCHLWNLLAANTREGEVFQRLLMKLDQERKSLGGKVFDILGALFEEVSLKHLLMDAIRYGEDPEVRERMHRAIDGAVATEHIHQVLAQNALNQTVLDQTRVLEVRARMDMAEARKLQPHFVSDFFFEAFRTQAGEWKERERGRYALTKVPARLRERDRELAGRLGEQEPVRPRYDRVCFEKAHVDAPGSTRADLLHPGHPLMQALMDVVLEEHRPTLKAGAMLLDPSDPGREPSLLFILDHRIQDAQGGEAQGLDVSRELHFVRVGPEGQAEGAGFGPHLDLQALHEAQRALLWPLLPEAWKASAGVEAQAMAYAVEHLAQPHFERVRAKRRDWVARTRAAVEERLRGEMRHWDHRLDRLMDDHKAGKVPMPQVQRARERLDEITQRLNRRLAELDAAGALRPGLPAVVGAAVVVPQGLLDLAQGLPGEPPQAAVDRARVEALAMQAVRAAEEALGHQVEDVSAQKCGWDLTSRAPNGRELHLEVKGRRHDATTLTVTRNEVLYALNQSDKFVLAIVPVDGDRVLGPFYLRRPFTQALDWHQASGNFEIAALLGKACRPEELPR